MSKDKQHMYDAMAESGIGRRFHAIQLKTKGTLGENLLARIKSGEMIDYTTTGGGYSFFGSDSYEFSILTCRALLLSDCSVQVMSLASLVRVIDDGEYTQKLTDADILLITGFCSDIAKMTPLTLGQRLQIEDLLSDRWDNSYPVFIQSDDRLDTYSDWWSRGILKRVSIYNESVEVGRK